MNDWGDAERKQALLIDIELKEYFRYIKNEFIAFKDVVAKMEMHKNAYYKAESRLMQKKEELFKQGNIARWELSPEDLKKYDKNELLKNKELAFNKMMQKVKIFLNKNKNIIFLGNSTCVHLERKLWLLFISAVI